jgi:glycosyltransferase involved in cell wall biosynthesis
VKILLLSRYENLGASSRMRFLQYLPFLQAAGIDVTVAPLLDNNYLKNLYTQKPLNITRIFSAYLHRLMLLFKSSKFDLLLVEKELFPWLPSFAELLLARLGIPYVVDYDDAVFHTYDTHSKNPFRNILGKKIDTVMRHAALVIAGNSYLAGQARQAGAKRVEVLPTVIDLDRYRLLPRTEKDYFSVGWIGTPVTERYLGYLKPVLAEISGLSARIKLVLIGAHNIKVEGVPMQFRPWSDKTEVADIYDFDVGIMPLPDSPWERGKCGYKLIQYMACSKPVIASPVGVNQEIVDHGSNGFLASTLDEWSESLRILFGNESLRSLMGRAGREKVENSYCVQVTSSRLATLLKSVVKEY